RLSLVRHTTCSSSLLISLVVLRVATQTSLGLRVILALACAIFRIIRMWSQQRNSDLHPDMKGG
ncbi:MAG: hypothetical protein ACRD8Z_03420, partial [Nitrososphaeraceae archaeon]